MTDHDLDVLFGGKGAGQTWRNTLTGEALELVEQVERRIVESGARPVFTRVASVLQRHGVTISSSSVGDHFRHYAKQNNVEW